MQAQYQLDVYIGTNVIIQQAIFQQKFSFSSMQNVVNIGTVKLQPDASCEFCLIDVNLPTTANALQESRSISLVLSYRSVRSGSA